MTSKVSVACVMMQRDEDALLPCWIEHHAALFGYENLHILDNGSTSPDVLRCLAKARMQGVTVTMRYCTPADYELKGELLKALILGIEQRESERIDFIFPLDCDEFVGALENGAARFDEGSVLNSLASHMSDQGVLKIAYAMVNCPGVTDRFVIRPESKCFFRSGTLSHLDHGAHRARSRYKAPDVSTQIIYVHLRNKPFHMVQAAARAKLKLRMKDFSEESLRSYTSGRGKHLPKYLLMSEREYLRSNRKDSFSSQSFESRLRALSLKPPFDVDLQSVRAEVR